MFLPTFDNYQKLSDEELYSIMAVRNFSGLQISNDRLEFILGNSSLVFYSHEEKSLAKIFQYCRDIRTNGDSRPFHLSAQSMAQLVTDIDYSPSHLGFRYHEVLHRECELLVPFVIDERADLPQVLLPIINWRYNRFSMQSHFIGIALMLALFHRFVRADKRWATADWSRVINAVDTASVEFLPMAVNDAFQAAIADIESGED